MTVIMNLSNNKIIVIVNSNYDNNDDNCESLSLLYVKNIEYISLKKHGVGCAFSKFYCFLIYIYILLCNDARVNWS